MNKNKIKRIADFGCIVALSLGVIAIARHSQQETYENTMLIVAETEPISVQLPSISANVVDRLGITADFLETETTNIIIEEETIEETEETIFISNDYETYSVYDDCGMWTWMPFTAVTSVSSPQYRLLNSNDAYTDEETGIRCYQGRYCIALGSYYISQIGIPVDLVLEDGTTLECVTGDQKADSDTDWQNRKHPDGSLVEFIISRNCLDSNIRKMGNVRAYNGYQWQKIKEIRVYKTPIF